MTRRYRVQRNKGKKEDNQYAYFAKNSYSYSSLSLTIANTLSNFFSPSIVTLYTFSLIIVSYAFRSEVPLAILLLISLIVLLFSYLIPWKVSKFLQDILRLKPKESRILREGVGLCSYAIAAALTLRFTLQGFKLACVVFAVNVAYVIICVLLIIFEFFTKPSVHESVLTASLLILSLYVERTILLILPVAVILLGWSRVKLRAHSFYQVILGCAIGICAVVLGTTLSFRC